MSNSLGKIFRLTTCGESHGPGYMAIVDGCPAGVELSAADVQKDLDRRRPGQSSQVSQRREKDEVEIMSGIFEGKTTGAPIGLLIRNHDARERDYETLKDKFRPGHADFTYFKKYGIRDHRGGGRASARETMLWVAAGAIAKKCLPEIKIQAYLSQMGNIKIEKMDASEIDRNSFFFPDASKIKLLEELIKNLRKEGNSIGARVSVEVSNMPVGLGEPVFDKLQANIAKAFMSIPAAKAVDIGDGFDVVTQKGSEHRDEISDAGFLTNHAGGILGGISTGQNLRASVAFKPASSIRIPARGLDIHHQPCKVVTTGRHDPCVGIRAVPVVEGLMAILLLDHLLSAKAYCLN